MEQFQFKYRSNFGEVDVAPAQLPLTRPQTPTPQKKKKKMFVSGKRNYYRNFIESTCIFSYDAWDVAFKRYPQSLHFHKI